MGHTKKYFFKQLAEYPYHHFNHILDDNISMECLAANVNSNSNYIKVFPVDCDTKIADSAMCMMPFKDTKLRQMVLRLFIDVFTKILRYCIQYI
jgi:hypothetical protein